MCFPDVGLANQTDLVLMSVRSLQFSDRLVGLVVKASASTVDDPGFKSRLRESYH